MRRIFAVALAAVLIACLAFSPAEAKKKTITGSAITDLVVGTSSVSDTSTSIDITGYDYIGLTTQIVVASGGGAGAGLFYVEGSVDAGVWTKVAVIDFADTNMIRTDIPFAGTASLQKSIVVSVLGYTVADDDVFDGFWLGNYLPYDKLRVIVTDTNWNAAATFSYDWIVE
jgi:hypothetical protein